MSRGHERQLLQKIVILIASIRGKLTESGMTGKQIQLFFSLRVFNSGEFSSSGEEFEDMINRQIRGMMAKAKKSRCSVKKLLAGILEKLEIENGFIEEYENYQPEAMPQVEIRKRNSSQYSLIDPPELNRQGSVSIWEKMCDSESSAISSKITPRLNKLMNFERELNESLMKTKMLKRIIQKRLIEEVEDTYSSRIRHIQELLALESSG